MKDVSAAISKSHQALDIAQELVRRQGSIESVCEGLAAAVARSPELWPEILGKDEAAAALRRFMLRARLSAYGHLSDYR